MSSHCHRGFCALAWTLIFSSAAWAQTISPTTFTYQGLLKQNGVPVNGTVTMAFSLWDAAGSGNPPSGGNSLATSVPMSVQVVNGLFSVPIDFGPSAFNGSNRWIQVELLATGTSLAPRQRVAPTPMAIYAETSGAPWITTGNDIYYSAGKIGMGWSTPNGRLHVYPQFFGPAGGGGIYLGGDPHANGFTGLAIDLSAAANGYATLQAIKSARHSYGNIVMNPAGGKVGIGDLDDTFTGQLEVLAADNVTGLRLSYTNGGSNAVAIQIHRTGSSRDAAIFQGDSGTGSRLRVSNDYTGVTGNPNELLDSGVWSFGSDQRLKRDIHPLEHNLDKSLALRPVSFYFKNQDLKRNSQKSLGFIAQEVQKVLPELIHGSEKEFLTLDYTSMVSVAIGAINELHAKTQRQLAEKDREINDLRVDVSELRSQVKELSRAVEQIQSQRITNNSEQTVSYGD